MGEDAGGGSGEDAEDVGGAGTEGAECGDGEAAGGRGADACAEQRSTGSQRGGVRARKRQNKMAVRVGSMRDRERWRCEERGEGVWEYHYRD